MALFSRPTIGSYGFNQIGEIIAGHKKTLIVPLIFFVATASFLWPMFTHISTYSDGGDHMFNAWTLARNHHCILWQDCQSYSNANIFFPHKDTMLYSETQFSAGLLTLPFFLINQNPLFSANVWYFLSTFFTGFFMYLLASHLSKGDQAVSVMAGLVFAFAPLKVISVDHLQSLSIFYLPLIILLLLKYRETGQKKYLGGFTIASSLLFLASWYQMIFGLVIIGMFVLFVLITDKKIRKRSLLLIAATIIAIATTLPLAKDYIRFSKANNATFSIDNQITYSASVEDYFLPHQNTLFGTLFYKLQPHVHRNGYNQDNYSYSGITLYVVMGLCLSELFRKKRNPARQSGIQYYILLSGIFLAGFIISIGPALKISRESIYHLQSTNFIIAAPYLLVDKLLPQLSFMRALGRASVIVLFALCCFLALFAIQLLSHKQFQHNRRLLTIVLVGLIGLDLLPLSLATNPFHHISPRDVRFSIPAVYQYIKADKSIDNLVVIRSDKDYPDAALPTALPEDILWAGYHNKNIFNGYSGYYPTEYQSTLQGFIDLQPGTVEKMKGLGLKYVILDKQLSTGHPNFEDEMTLIFSKKVYEDKRYDLFKI